MSTGMRELARVNRRAGIFLRVRGGRLHAYSIAPPDRRTGIALAGQPTFEADAAVAHFHRMLTDAGLTGGEADGLIAAWRSHFFEAEGERFLLILSAADYDALCPIL